MTTSGTRLVGSLRPLGDGKGVVRMEDVYETDPHDLWSALTDPERLARWIAHVEGDLRVGGSITARFTSSWEGPGRVDVCDQPNRLVVTMNPGAEDETVIEVVLTPEGDRTRLVVEDRGIPMGELYAHGAGWQAHVEDLATYLRGDVPADWRTRWQELSPAYKEIAADLESR
jgi:uncharacterized protein YndB with AHSA1/START domain